jgi:hypothetical protein
MKFMFILAAIPVLTLSGGYALRPAPPARAVEVEGIRAQRMDTDTFRYRYGPVADLPPAVETRLEPLLLVDAEERLTKPATNITKNITMRTVRVVQTYSVCTRHGMRKVMVGRYKWRCRR